MTIPFNFLLVTCNIVLQCPYGYGGQAERCYQCNELNRMWEFATCHNKVGDCGDCYSGYQLSRNASKCFPMELNDVIMDDDSNVTIPTHNHYPRGGRAKLTCRTDGIYECLWKHNNRPVEIDGRHLWDKKLSNECSLEIVDFRDEDTGQWTCEVFENPELLKPDRVRHCWLHLRDSNVLYARENETWAVPVGQPVVLACYFQTEVDCFWKRLGNDLEIQPGKYSYVDKTNGQMTTDCTLRVQDFREADDVGKWQCHGFTVSSHTDVRKPYIELVVPGSLGECPRRQPCVLNARENETVILKCEFKEMVKSCAWKYGGPAINGAFLRSYKFLDNEGKGTRNCSIIIPKIIEELHERTYECEGVTESGEIKVDQVYDLKVERDKPTASTTKLWLPPMQTNGHFDPSRSGGTLIMWKTISVLVLAMALLKINHHNSQM